jgi:hypothetical protein
MTYLQIIYLRIISEDKDNMEVVLSGVIEGIAAIDKKAGLYFLIMP